LKKLAYTKLRFSDTPSSPYCELLSETSPLRSGHFFAAPATQRDATAIPCFSSMTSVRRSVGHESQNWRQLIAHNDLIADDEGHLSAPMQKKCSSRLAKG
jgi:hypothetical protein